MSMRLVARVLAAALGLGLLGDWLLGEIGIGLNLFLGLGALMASAAVLVRLHGPSTPAMVHPLMLLPPLVGLGVLWRSAPGLAAANLVALAVVLSLPVVRMGGVRLPVARLVDYAGGFVATGLRTLLGPLHLISANVPWQEAFGGLRRRRTASILVGLLIAMPLLLVFSALFASADAGFEHALQSIFALDFESLFEHGFRTGLIGWISCGYLLAALSGVGVPSERWSVQERPKLGALELGIPLVALTVLFTAFVVMQAEYVFGGQQLVQSSEGLGYAEYARRGFFELVAVSVLVLPVLLGANWLTCATDPISCRVVRGLSGGLLVPLGLIMMSAFHRLWIYVDAYGLTDSRVYAAAVLLWAGAAIAWLGLTVLRSRAERFAFGAMASAFAVLVALNVSNPDALVVRVNLARAESGAELDVPYLASLSADAAPALTSVLESDAVPGVLSEDDVCHLRGELERRWGDEEAPDWRSWSLGRARARRAVSLLGMAGGEASCG
jgi:hypothetical protein